MECHKCPYAEAVAAGKYRKLPFEKTPCGTCELKESSAFTIAFDESRAPSVEIFAEAAPFAEEVVATPEARLPISVLTEALAQILSMPTAVRDAVCMRYSGMSYREIADRQGVTAAAVEMRHWRAMRRWPALRALFAEKSAKQMRRKPHGGAGRRDRRIKAMGGCLPVSKRGSNL